MFIHDCVCVWQMSIWSRMSRACTLNTVQVCMDNCKLDVLYLNNKWRSVDRWELRLDLFKLLLSWFNHFPYLANLYTCILCVCIKYVYRTYTCILYLSINSSTQHTSIYTYWYILITMVPYIGNISKVVDKLSTRLVTLVRFRRFKVYPLFDGLQHTSTTCTETNRRLEIPSLRTTSHGFLVLYMRATRNPGRGNSS